MKTENNWLDGMHNHAASLREIAAQIRELGAAFMRTGNENVSGELFELAQEVRTQAEKASDLTATKVNGDYREAVQGTANALRAALAGAEMAKR